ncbi:hypothetical protein NDA01_30160 [Trichocoleus desertorum AS-A10]|uniref:plasmid mobilization protein n=1 Tax=Trichocoleus desertorum TaxID=1481672 RepID=UPI003298C06D
MSPQKRPIKFHIPLNAEEKEQVRRMAVENHLTMAELFRAKTLKNQLPRRVTRIARLTYWELTKMSDSLNQIANAIIVSPKANAHASTPSQKTLIVVDQALLIQTRTLLSQVRRELVEMNFMTEINEES